MSDGGPKRPGTTNPGQIGRGDNLRNWSPVRPASAKDAEIFDRRPDNDWLNPISMGTLKAAVEKKKPQVQLNGILYDITYGIMWKSKLIPDYECIKLKQADGKFGSFGYISMKRILNFDFEKGE
jgi:hypothetical protein